MVNAPGQRYHPAIVAQAAATLSEMYPGRFWLAVGSGENLNEHITGAPWPAKDVRNRRLKESIQVIKALWAGETVSHRGTFVLDEAKLFTRPRSELLVLGAALTPETARFIGGLTDGLITAGKEAADIARVVTAFKDGGGDGKPLYLQVALSIAETDEAALRSIPRQWRVAALSPQDLADIKTPALFDAACRSVARETLREKFRISSDWRQHLEWLQRDMELGFDAIYLNHVGQDLARFIDVFGEHVLPRCASSPNVELAKS